MGIGLLLVGFFTFVELNCENLFDCIDDTLKHDEEFLPEGSYQWSRTRYWRKLNAIGKEILACGEFSSDFSVDEAKEKDLDFQLPDLVALCEVESDSCLYDLTRRSLLRNARYQYFMTDSPDERGVDVALLWSPFTFKMLSYRSLRVTPPKGMRWTRDILYACGRVRGGDTLHVFVAHAPSRSGGATATEPYRLLVAERICAAVDSIFLMQPDAKIIVAGDLNAYHKDKSIRRLKDGGLCDLSEKARGRHGAEGTYRYHGEWGSLDHILASEAMASRLCGCYVFDALFLLAEDETYGGFKPFRTYLGPRYLGGFSDHLPLVARFLEFGR